MKQVSAFRVICVESINYLFAMLLTGKIVERRKRRLSGLEKEPFHLEVTESDDLKETGNIHIWSLLVQRGNQILSNDNFCTSLRYLMDDIVKSYQDATIAIPVNTAVKPLSPITVSEVVAEAFSKYKNFPDVEIFVCVETLELGQAVANVFEGILCIESSNWSRAQKFFYRENVSHNLFIINGMFFFGKI